MAGPKVGQRTTAWLAVAMLFAHTLFMGFHVPPALRAALAEAEQTALLAGLCHADPTTADRAANPGGSHEDGHDDGRHGSGGPVDPTAHLAHCPVCLSLAGGLLGPAAGPSLPVPDFVATTLRLPAADAPRRSLAASPFAARAPPTMA